MEGRPADGNSITAAFFLMLGRLGSGNNYISEQEGGVLRM